MTKNEQKKVDELKAILKRKGFVPSGIQKEGSATYHNKQGLYVTIHKGDF